MYLILNVVIFLEGIVRILNYFIRLDFFYLNIFVGYNFLEWEDVFRKKETIIIKFSDGLIYLREKLFKGI